MAPSPKAKSFRRLLSWDEVDAVYREPYILSGYRQSGTSFYQCLQYTLVLHNDVGNFWTHFIPFLLWLVWLWALAISWLDFHNPYHYPLFCFWAGACSYALFSSLAHLLSCKSFMIRTMCFILDYLGIAMYALGGGISALFYLSPTDSIYFSHKSILLPAEVCFAILATLLSGLSRFFWSDYRFIIRVSAYGLPYMCCVSPFLHRVYICWVHGRECVPETMYWHAMSILLTITLVFFFVTKIPERFIPGRFDFFLQSHQLFHVSAVGLTCIQMHFTPMEMHLRKNVLNATRSALPSWETTFLPFVCAEVLGLMVVGVLGYLTWNGTLTTNKYNKKKE